MPTKYTAQPKASDSLLSEKEGAFLQLVADQTSTLADIMEEKAAPPSLKTILQSVFSCIEIAHKEVTALKLKDEPLKSVSPVQDLKIYRTKFITGYFRSIISRFNFKLDGMQSFEYCERTLKIIDSIFEEKDWENTKFQLFEIHKKYEALFSEILSEQKKIKEDITFAKINYNYELPQELEIKDFSFKAEWNKYISEKIKKAYEKILDADAEYSRFEENVRFIFLHQKSEAEAKVLADKKLQEAQKFLNNKITDMQKEVEQLKKTYPDLSVVFPTDDEVTTRLKTIKETIYQSNQSKDKKSDEVPSSEITPSGRKPSTNLKVKRKKLKSRKSKTAIESKKEVSHGTPEIAQLKKDIIKFYKEEVDPKYSTLKYATQNQTDCPNFDLFWKDRLFDPMEEKHKNIVKNREAIEEEFSSAVIKVTPSDTRSIISLLIPSEIKEFPDFETMKGNFVRPFFEGYVSWFENALIKFKNVDADKQDVEKILEDKKASWNDMSPRLQQKYKNINAELDNKIKTFDEQYRQFKKDLERAEKKYNFKLSLVKDIVVLPDLHQVKKDFNDFVKTKITALKNAEYKKRFDVYLEDFNSKYVAFAEVKEFSIDKMSKNEENFSKIQMLHKDFHKKLRDEEKKIQNEIQALQKEYPGLVIAVPEKPTIDFEKIKKEWVTSLDKNWFEALDKIVDSFKEYKLDFTVEAEIKAVEMMPLPLVVSESKPKEHELKVETEIKATENMPLPHTSQESKTKDPEIKTDKPTLIPHGVTRFQSFKQNNYPNFDSLPLELKENFNKKKDAAKRLKLKYSPNRDECFDIIAAKCEGLARKPEILEILKKVLLQSKYDDLWEQLKNSDIAKKIKKLIPLQDIFLEDAAYAAYKKHLEARKIEEDEAFEQDYKSTENARQKQYNVVKTSLTPKAMEDREIKTFDQTSVSAKIKEDPQHVYDYWCNYEQNRIKAQFEKVVVEEPPTDSPSKPPKKKVKRLPVPEIQVEEIKKVEKPIEPKLNFNILDYAMVSLPLVGGLLYLAYHTYECFKYHQQMAEYNDYLCRDQFNKSLIYSKPRDSKKPEEIKLVPKKESDSKAENFTEPQRDKLNLFILSVSALTILGALAYLIYHDYKNRQYNKQMPMYLDKCSMWANKQRSPADETQNQTTLKTTNRLVPQ